MKLSVVIITFNEEDNIEKCLKSVQNITDEIIVVDSFSTDKTKEICQKYNVKFYEQKWLGYSQQKNYANSLATNNYILSIDADEVISEELEKSILSLTTFDGVYKFNRLTNYCGHWIKHCGWYPDAKIRIFPKNEVKWVGEFVHETLDIPNGTKLTQLKGDLLHYTTKTISQHINTINNFSGKSAMSKFTQGKRTNLLKILFKSKLKFFIMYFIKLGFLDGYYGYVVCKNSAHAAFLQETMMRELEKENSNKK